MVDKKDEKTQKPQQNGNSLKINTSLDDVLKASVPKQKEQKKDD